MKVRIYEYFKYITRCKIMQRKPATDKHTQSNVCLFLHKVVHIKLQLKIESWENKFDDLLNVHRKMPLRGWHQCSFFSPKKPTKYF